MKFSFDEVLALYGIIPLHIFSCVFDLNEKRIYSE